VSGLATMRSFRTTLGLTDQGLSWIGTLRHARFPKTDATRMRPASSRGHRQPKDHPVGRGEYSHPLQLGLGVNPVQAFGHILPCNLNRCGLRATPRQPARGSIFPEDNLQLLPETYS
jgi:hypothetical protein